MKATINLPDSGFSEVSLISRLTGTTSKLVLRYIAISQILSCRLLALFQLLVWFQWKLRVLLVIEAEGVLVVAEFFWLKELLLAWGKVIGIHFNYYRWNWIITVMAMNSAKLFFQIHGRKKAFSLQHLAWGRVNDRVRPRNLRGEPNVWRKKHHRE